MRVSRPSIWLALACATVSSTACRPERARPSLPPQPDSAAITRLVATIVATAVEKQATGPDRPLTVDVESFRAPAAAYAGHPVSRELIAKAIGRPFHDLSATSRRWPVDVLPRESATLNLGLDGLVIAGDWMDAVISLRAAFQVTRDSLDFEVEMQRLRFIREGAGWKLVERKPVLVS